MYDATIRARLRHQKAGRANPTLNQHSTRHYAGDSNPRKPNNNQPKTNVSNEEAGFVSILEACFRRFDLKSALKYDTHRGAARSTLSMKRSRGGARGAKGKGGNVLHGVVVCSTGLTNTVKVGLCLLSGALTAVCPRVRDRAEVYYCTF